MLFVSASPVIEQIPLIHDIFEDEQILLSSPDTEWYRILKFFPWQDYREPAALYYDALYHYNKSREQASASESRTDIEDRDSATQRLLFNRPTMNNTVPVLYEPEFRPVPFPTVSPASVVPGLPPHRGGGPKPKCFFAMFKSFIGASLMGFAPEPENVRALLTSNLPFARVCGFIPGGADEGYWFRYVPGLRKLEQFDQIMRDYGIWDRAKWDEVRKNIGGTIKKEDTLVGDTTHYHAFSNFQTVTYTDNTGKEKKKSQSYATKNCRCKDRETCPHQWELTDEGAGTIVKSSNKIMWGHKASVIGLPKQGVPLDARAVADAATNDGKTFLPHIRFFFENMPEIEQWFTTALYDSACDDQGLKDQFRNDLGIELKTSLNPRRRKTVTENLPDGMAKLTPYGILTCRGGYEMNFKGVRYDTGSFIYQAPADKESNTPVCLSCEHYSVCGSLAANGRTVTLPFNVLPHISPSDPPMSQRFRSLISRRPSVERMIKRLKCDLSDDRLKKRGNASFQAYLDKTMIAFHILLRQ